MYNITNQRLYLRTMSDNRQTLFRTLSGSRRGDNVKI